MQVAWGLGCLQYFLGFSEPSMGNPAELSLNSRVGESPLGSDTVTEATGMDWERLVIQSGKAGTSSSSVTLVTSAGR